MHIFVLIAIFVVFYCLQLWLCLKVKNKHIKRIPLYLCLVGLLYASALYVEFFGHYSAGGWAQLEAVIYFILIGAVLVALLAACLTGKCIRRGKENERKKA